MSIDAREELYFTVGEITQADKADQICIGIDDNDPEFNQFNGMIITPANDSQRARCCPSFGILRHSNNQTPFTLSSNVDQCGL